MSTAPPSSADVHNEKVELSDGTDEEDVRTAYDAVCEAFHRIEEFRGKLLALLPLASGTGIFLLLNKDLHPAHDGVRAYLVAAGLLGFLVTLGLFIYELRGIQRCIVLIDAGKRLEEAMKIPDLPAHKKGPKTEAWPKSKLAQRPSMLRAGVFHEPDDYLRGHLSPIGAGYPSRFDSNACSI